jgi:Family of unknown function (DUF5808)
VKGLRRTIRIVVLNAAVAALIGAIVQQLKLPPEERTWRGRIAGIPYDFRFPTIDRIKSRWWNPSDARIFTPKSFGVGWDINVYRLLHLNTPPETAVDEWDELS